MLNEVSPNGEEYFRFFRQECRRRGVTIAAVETVQPDAGATSPRTSPTCGAVEADALAYMGYGMLVAQGLLRPALDEIGWDPPRIMTTAFMFYLVGFDNFEGWVGIDQFCPDNPPRRAVPRRVTSRATAADPPMWPNAIPRARLRHRARHGRGAAPRTGPHRLGAEGRARADPLHARARPAARTRTSPAARTTTRCSRATGCSTAGSRDGELEFEGLFEPWE